MAPAGTKAAEIWPTHHRGTQRMIKIILAGRGGSHATPRNEWTSSAKSIIPGRSFILRFRTSSLRGGGNSKHPRIGLAFEHWASSGCSLFATPIPTSGPRGLKEDQETKTLAVPLVPSHPRMGPELQCHLPPLGGLRHPKAEIESPCAIANVRGFGVPFC